MSLRFVFAFVLAISTCGALPALAETTTKVLPQLAFGAGWSTTIYLTNPNSGSASASIQFYGTDGTALPIAISSTEYSTSVTFTLAAHSTKSFAVTNPLLVASVSSGLIQGSAKLTLDANVTGYAIFRQSVTGYNDQEAVVNFASADSTSSLLLFDDTDYVTTLAIFNPTGYSSNIRIDSYLEDGTASNTSVFALNPLARGAYVLTDLIPALKGHQGAIVVRTLNAGGVSVLGLRFNGLAFTSILPTEQ